MQIHSFSLSVCVSLCLCLSLLLPPLPSLFLLLSLTSVCIFFKFMNKILYRTLLRLRRAVIPPTTCVYPSCCLWFCSCQAPQREKVASLLPSLGWEYSHSLSMRTSPGSRHCIPPPPHPSPAPSTIFSFLHFPPTSHLHLHPFQKALGFSFLKCGLKIIFGKLTSSPSNFPHHHRRESILKPACVAAS